MRGGQKSREDQHVKGRWSKGTTQRRWDKNREFKGSEDMVTEARYFMRPTEMQGAAHELKMRKSMGVHPSRRQREGPKLG